MPIPHTQLVSDTALAAAMLSALPEEWGLEGKIFFPLMVIAKVQVEWHGKSLNKQLGGGNIYFGHGGDLTPSSFDLFNYPNSNYLTSPASPMILQICCHPHFGNAPTGNHKLCEAHGWQMDHGSEDCYALCNLCKDLAAQKSQGRGKGRGGLRGGLKRRANVTEAIEAHAVQMGDKGQGHTNITQLAYCDATRMEMETDPLASLATANTRTLEDCFTMHPDSGTNYHMSGDPTILQLSKATNLRS